MPGRITPSTSSKSAGNLSREKPRPSPGQKTTANLLRKLEARVVREAARDNRKRFAAKPRKTRKLRKLTEKEAPKKKPPKKNTKVGPLASFVADTQATPKSTTQRTAREEAARNARIKAYYKNCKKLGITEDGTPAQQRNLHTIVLKKSCKITNPELREIAKKRKCAGRSLATKKTQLVRVIRDCPKQTPTQKKNNNTDGLVKMNKEVNVILKKAGINGGMKGLHSMAREVRGDAHPRNKKHQHYKALHKPTKKELEAMRGKGKNDNLFQVNKSVDLVLDYHGIVSRADLYKQAARNIKKDTPTKSTKSKSTKSRKT